MSGVRVIWYLLKTDAAVLAKVPAAKILTGTLPVKTVLPAISVRQISGVEPIAVDHGPGQVRTDRVQVTVLAPAYDVKREILDLVRTACATRRGTVNGVNVDAILTDGEGPDLDDPEAKIYEQSRDFLIRWTA